ncbi:MAG: anthranilate phosphoribosyltransferase [Balneolaceae bacterium]
MFIHTLEKISLSEDLTAQEAEESLQLIVNGEVSNEEVAAFLFGMRAKGEKVEELTAFVRVMREAATPIHVDIEGAVDLCGTGGDKSGTFNISTAAMFIVAGAGVPVLKHGNRSVSSKSGSYDVLETLGAVPNLQKEDVEKLYEHTGVAFMFAPNFHPAMKYVMPARRALKMRTFFNMLGPLLNPAGVRNQVVGAFSREAAEIMIQILANLETESALTLNAHDGLDEVSLSSDTQLFELKSNLVGESKTFNPESLGYKKVGFKELLGGDADYNASILENIVNGSATLAQRNIAELNAAFAIYSTGKADSLEEAVEMASESIDSGRAKQKLKQFIEISQKLA